MILWIDDQRQLAGRDLPREIARFDAISEIAWRCWTFLRRAGEHPIIENDNTSAKDPDRVYTPADIPRKCGALLFDHRTRIDREHVDDRRGRQR